MHNDSNGFKLQDIFTTMLTITLYPQYLETVTSLWICRFSRILTFDMRWIIHSQSLWDRMYMLRFSRPPRTGLSEWEFILATLNRANLHRTIWSTTLLKMGMPVFFSFLMALFSSDCLRRALHFEVRIQYQKILNVSYNFRF